MSIPDYQRLKELFNRILENCESQPENVKGFLPEMESALNNLASDDFFGTEGQSDPRGDHRDGEWSVWKMQGLDYD